MEQHYEKYVIAGIVIVALSIGGFYTASRLSKNNAGVSRSTTPQKVKDGVILTLRPSKTTVASGEVFTVDVVADTKMFSIGAVEVYVSFPAGSVTVESIATGDFLPVELKKGVFDSTSASITLGSKAGEPRQGTGVVATLRLKASAIAQSFQIKLDDTTQVASIGQDGNTVESLMPATVVIQ